MFEKHLLRIQEEFKENLAKEFTTRITGFHRIQASPGIKGAAQYVSTTLRNYGLKSEVLHYPAKKGVMWWTCDSFQEWACTKAELILIEGDKREILCSYDNNKLSVIQFCNGTPEGGVKTTLVYVDKAEEEDSYKNVDVRGKLVFSRGDVKDISRLAVGKHGALGIVVDNMREIPHIRGRCDLPDAKQYTAIWREDAESSGCGFVVTPRQGEMLRQKCEYGKKELPVFANVLTKRYDGQIPVVNTLIEGNTKEEVVAVAHLCHPQPSANDNASGCSTLMETARTINQLISDGILPKPKRSIRFLLLPEMTGSYAYLSQNEDLIPNVVAAVNLDMVGENQDLCKSTFIVEKPPRATSCAGGHLAEAILRYLAKQTNNLTGTAAFSTFRWAITPFAGGSDHYIWADPTVGITCPSLAQWPDKFYHTSADTIDKVDPAMLKLAGVLAGTYLYWFATAGPKEATWLAQETVSHLPFELYNAEREILGAHLESDKTRSNERKAEEISKVRRTLEKRIRFIGDRTMSDLKSLSAFSEAFSDSSQEAETRNLNDYIQNTVAFWIKKANDDLALTYQLEDTSALPGTTIPEDEYEHKCKHIVAERTFRGPCSLETVRKVIDNKNIVDAFAKQWKNEMSSFTYVLYWLDGKRSLSAVADLIEGETGRRNARFLIDCVELMEKAKLAELKRL